MSESIREKVIRLIKEMQNRTVERGATPAEAAAFAAKVSEWIEKYQIEEAELQSGKEKGAGPKIEVTENKIRTGKKVFNPGVTQLVAALARAMSCKCVMIRSGARAGIKDTEATYGITGDTLDADYVCSIAMTLIPSLELSANIEGWEHGYEGGPLVRWRNQYLTGAAIEIEKRIVDERRARSDVREVEGKLSGGALVVITGDQLALLKKAAAEAEFKRRYPHTRTTTSNSGYDPTAHERGREAGKRASLHQGIEGE